MDTHTQVFRNHRAAAGAFLRCASGVNAQHSTTGTFSLVRGELHELAPGHVRDASIDGAVSVGLHVLNVKVLEDDQAEAVDELAALLVREVGAPVGGVKVRLISPCLKAGVLRRWPINTKIGALPDGRTACNLTKTEGLCYDKYI